MKIHEFAAIGILLLLLGAAASVAFNGTARAGAATGAGAGGSVYYASTPSSPAYAAGGAATAGSGGAAYTPKDVVIPIKIVGGTYQPREIHVNQGDRVTLQFDASTFTGCMTTFNIWGLNQRITVSQSQNTLTFVADKPGQYKMSCPMGMGNGLFYVDVPGQPAASAAAPVAGPSGGSCGGSGGGCGCGGGGAAASAPASAPRGCGG